MQATHADAEQRYDKIRKETLRAAENLISRDYAQLRLTTLDERFPYKGIFCSEAIKQACEAAGLLGVNFNPNVSNPIGEDYSTEQ